MLGQYIIENLNMFLGSLLSGASVYFFERYRRRAELKSLQADNAQKIVDLYQEAMDDLKIRYDEKFTNARDDYNEKTTNLIKNFEDRHQQLEKKFEHLQREHDNWKKKYTALKKEFEEYRERHKVS